MTKLCAAMDRCKNQQSNNILDKWKCIRKALSVCKTQCNELWLGQWMHVVSYIFYRIVCFQKDIDNFLCFAWKCIESSNDLYSQFFILLLVLLISLLAVAYGCYFKWPTHGAETEFRLLRRHTEKLRWNQNCTVIRTFIDSI